MKCIEVDEESGTSVKQSLLIAIKLYRPCRRSEFIDSVGPIAIINQIGQFENTNDLLIRTYPEMTGGTLF